MRLLFNRERERQRERDRSWAIHIERQLFKSHKSHCVCVFQLTNHVSEYTHYRFLPVEQGDSTGSKCLLSVSLVKTVCLATVLSAAFVDRDAEVGREGGCGQTVVKTDSTADASL